MTSTTIQMAVIRSNVRFFINIFVKVPFLHIKVPIESRQSHEVDGYLGLESAHPFAEAPPAVDDGINCQWYHRKSG